LLRAGFITIAGEEKQGKIKQILESITNTNLSTFLFYVVRSKYPMKSFAEIFYGRRYLILLHP
jgi:hypothetical protein